MHTVETPAGWATVIAELEAKHQSAMQHIEGLRAQKHELALDASMGSEDARKHLKAINAELNRLSYEVDNLNTALATARDQKKAAEDVVAAEAELARQSNIAAAMRQYYEEAGKIDDAMRLLVEHFVAARQHLDRAESFMNTQERMPLQQLRTFFGSTLAAAHFGLGEWIRLGSEAQHVTHRQPFARFALGIIDRWVLEPPTEEAAKTNGDAAVGGE
jgi:hypothetical protein